MTLAWGCIHGDTDLNTHRLDIFSSKECAPWPRRECGGDGEGEQMNNRNTALLATVPTVTTVTTDQLYIKWCSCSLSGHSCHPPQWEVSGGANVSHSLWALSTSKHWQSSWILQTSFVYTALPTMAGGSCTHRMRQSAPTPASHCVSPSYSQYNCLLHITRFIASYYHNMQYFQCLW